VLHAAYNDAQGVTAEFNLNRWHASTMTWANLTSRTGTPRIPITRGGPHRNALHINGRPDRACSGRDARLWPGERIHRELVQILGGADQAIAAESGFVSRDGGPRAGWFSVVLVS
jgi:hypothetical protein